jgi:hypothetical protein
LIRQRNWDLNILSFAFREELDSIDFPTLELDYFVTKVEQKMAKGKSEWGVVEDQLLPSLISRIQES